MNAILVGKIVAKMVVPVLLASGCATTALAQTAPPPQAPPAAQAAVPDHPTPPVQAAGTLDRRQQFPPADETKLLTLNGIFRSAFQGTTGGELGGDSADARGYGTGSFEAVHGWPVALRLRRACPRRTRRRSVRTSVSRRRGRTPQYPGGARALAVVGADRRRGGRRQRTTWGSGVSIDQSITPTVGVFVRCGLSRSEGETLTSSACAGGMQFTPGWWQRAKDRLGVGYTYQREAAGSEKLVEAYWSFAVYKLLWVTADVQWLIAGSNEEQGGQNRHVLVPGVRAAVLF